MSRRTGWAVLAAVFGVAIAAAMGVAAFFERTMPDEWTEMRRLPQIHPNYDGTVIPPNIAPLNFAMDEPGESFCVRIGGANGRSIDIPGRGSAVLIPPGPWRRLLYENRGGVIRVEVFVRDADGWKRFDTITNRVAEEEIDSHLVYRLLGPAYFAFHRIAIWQRDLESFDESPLLSNASFGGGCVNCHAFAANRPERFSFHVRPPTDGGFDGGMIEVEDGKAVRIPSSPASEAALPAYTAWHPSAPLAAFSRNNQGLFMRGAGVEPREVYDLKSDLAVFDAKTGEISPVPDTGEQRTVSTFPAWSADGEYLYYSSAAVGASQPPYDSYASIKYDLMRIRYDARSGAWGKPEIVLSAAKTGQSITQPRPSPDGRYLVFCMSPHGCFPVLSPGANLYLMDLAEDRQFAYRPLEKANSTEADSWHCWSSNSRWIVFSSKRGTGLFARPYLCYVDREGNVQKPFVLPQRDPRFYDTCLQTFNVPELVRGPVKVAKDDLARAILSDAAPGP